MLCSSALGRWVEAAISDAHTELRFVLRVSTSGTQRPAPMVRTGTDSGLPEAHVNEARLVAKDLIVGRTLIHIVDRVLLEK